MSGHAVVTVGRVAAFAIKYWYAEAIAEKARADREELAWAAGRKSLNAAIKESIGARESEKWWREKANQSSLSANRRGVELEASQAALAEQLAARKVDADTIETMARVIEREDAEVYRLKKRVNGLIRKAKR